MELCYNFVALHQIYTLHSTSCIHSNLCCNILVGNQEDNMILRHNRYMVLCIEIPSRGSISL